jgi:hypothetical protein
VKLLIVAAVVFVVIAGKVIHRRWKVGLQRPVAHPRLPTELAGGWVVFTTPYCATCEPVKEQLRAVDPSAPLHTVDATREPRLADAFKIRSAPTALLSDGRGEVRERLVGAAAVAAYAERVASAKAG